MLWIALAGCGGSPLEGKLVNGMTGQPLPETRIIARATQEDASMTCMTLEGSTDSEGAFTISGLCGSTPYTLSTDQETLWLADVDEIPAGGVSDPIEVKAWRAPSGDGLYELSEDALDTIRTAAAVKSERVRDTDDTFTYPSEIPPDSRIPLIEDGEYLVFVGRDMITNYRFAPLVDVMEPIKIGTTQEPYTLSNIATIGLAFTDATTFERRPGPTVDTSKLLEKAKGDKTVRYMPFDAVPPGRYALHKEGEERLYIVDFTKRPAPATPE